MTIEFDDPIYQEEEDEETNLKLLDAQDQKQELGMIENQLKESWNPTDNCTADSENLMDIIDSQSHGKELY